jgi:methanogenic corrinoid protein MtbC1
VATMKLLDEFLQPLLAGQRQACREVLHKAIAGTREPRELYHKLMWPAMERIESMFREDRINIATEHMATRISRCLADQLQTFLPRRDPNGKRVIIACAEGEPEELGAQMCADLFEADGWDVYFLGGGIPNDEALALVGQLRPDLLLIFGTQPSGVPGVRKLIDLIREVDANPHMNIMISGGVFNRAAGLWQEISADLFACNAEEALATANAARPRTPTARVPGAPKKRRRRRRPPLLAQLEAQAEA